MKKVSIPWRSAGSCSRGIVLGLAAWVACIHIPWSAAPALAAPGGELDVTFGVNGQLHIGGGRNGVAVVQQPADGKLVVASEVTSANLRNDFGVHRLNPDGSLDGHFGISGVTSVDFYGDPSQAMAMTLAPDGGIVVAGMAYINGPIYRSAVALAKLDTNGRLDTSFGGDGRVIVPGPGGRDVGVSAIELVDNGRLLVVGTISTAQDDDLMLLRFNSDGSLDTTFGTGAFPGMTVVDLGMWAAPAAVVRQPDGELIVCGTRYNGWDPPSQMFAVRLTTDGTIDAGFGVNGLWHMPSGQSSADACVLMPDGTLVLGGQIDTMGPALARLRADGALDTAAWSRGLLRVEATGIEAVEAIVPVENGHLAIAGAANRRATYGPTRLGEYSNPSFPINDVYIARLDPDAGLLDPAFGDRGVTLVDFGHGSFGAEPRIGGLIRQTDGKLVVVAGLGWQDALDSEWTADDYERLTAIALARIDPAGGGNTGFFGFARPFMAVREGEATVVLQVRRTGGSVGNVLVDYSTLAATAMDPFDFTASSGTLTWLDGDMEPKLITLPITDDETSESDEHFHVLLSSISGAMAGSLATVWIRGWPPSPSGAPTTAPVGSGASLTASGGAGAFAFDLFLLLLAASPALTRRIRFSAPTASE